MAYYGLWDSLYVLYGPGGSTDLDAHSYLHPPSNHINDQTKRQKTPNQERFPKMVVQSFSTPGGHLPSLGLNMNQGDFSQPLLTP